MESSIDSPLKEDSKLPLEKTATPVAPDPAARTLEKEADVTVSFLRKHEHLVEPLTPEKEAKLKRKLYGYVVVLAMVIDLVLYVRSDVEDVSRGMLANK